MKQQISIARTPEEVFRHLADERHLGEWLPQLRREEGPLPEGELKADRAAGTVRWPFEPAGEFRVTGSGRIATVHLTLEQEVARPNDPTEAETPHEAAEHGMEAALQSLKSHLERAGGGDPAEPTEDAPSRLYGHSATQEPGI